MKCAQTELQCEEKKIVEIGACETEVMRENPLCKGIFQKPCRWSTIDEQSLSHESNNGHPLKGTCQTKKHLKKPSFYIIDPIAFLQTDSCVNLNLFFFLLFL